MSCCILEEPSSGVRRHAGARTRSRGDAADGHDKHQAKQALPIALERGVHVFGVGLAHELAHALRTRSLDPTQVLSYPAVTHRLVSNPRREQRGGNSLWGTTLDKRSIGATLHMHNWAPRVTTHVQGQSGSRPAPPSMIAVYTFWAPNTATTKPLRTMTPASASTSTDTRPVRLTSLRP